MPEAKLRLELPENVWIGELTRRYPDATFTILAALSDSDDGVGLAEIRSKSLPVMLEDIKSYDDVSKLDVLNQTEEQALVQIETTLPILLLPAHNSGIPLEMPFELSDGSAVWELQTSSDRLSELSEQLDHFDISFTIDYIQYEVDETQLLTSTQEKLIQKAVEMGYYDSPRRCSLTELAEEVDRSKSTVSETLHRAEGTVVKEIVDRQ